MATKESRRQVRGLIEGLERRVHSGPPVANVELEQAREFLKRNEFSLASDYYGRLSRIEGRLQTRLPEASIGGEKRNYGGEAGGRLLQVQSVFDHVIVSTCYEGSFRAKWGRI